MKVESSRQIRVGCAAGLLFIFGSSFLLGMENNLLKTNPGFEAGEEGWTFATDSMGEISADAAQSGGQGLRIRDDSPHTGSSVMSERIPVTPGAGYLLSFWARTVSDGGMGVYLRYYDEGGRKPISSDHIDISSKQTSWKFHELNSIAPENAATVEIWIHSYGPTRVVADIDELSLIPSTFTARPPWVPQYKISPEEKSRLTEADVVGPDGLVYPNWREAGVPGGIPNVATVIGPDFFQSLENQDVSIRLREAIHKVAAAGGGAVSLPAGTFYLDRPVIIRDSGVVLRGAGRDQTRLIFRDRIPRGEIRLFNWSETGNQIGPGGVVEIQTNPKDLSVLQVEAAGEVLKKASRETEGKGWGNRFALRLDGNYLFSHLGPGDHDLVATATYANGDHFTNTLKISLDQDASPQVSPDQNGILALIGAGKKGNPIQLTQDGKRGDRKLSIAKEHGLRAGDRVLLDAPVTERWSQLVGNTSKASHFRQYAYEIAEASDDSITLTQPLRIEFPTIDGSFVQKAGYVENSGIEDLTIEQQAIPEAPNAVKPVSLRYWYPIEDLWMDGVTSSYAWGCWIRNVSVVNAGRNPIFLTRSKFSEVRDCEADGALFKGGGGTGYVGLERSFDCLMDSVVTHNMRHAPNLQWGAAGNVVRNGRFYGSDAQWHAGWTNENLMEGNLIVSDLNDIANNNTYGYGLFSTGPKDPIHGPEGPRNVAYRNDVASPKDGLYMQGGNEAWIIVYNRFRIADGRAVYAGNLSFDHIIRGNTFILEKAADPAVLLESLNCTGIELEDNTFYGPVKTVSGFLKGIGKLAREENNRVLPYTDTAPLPDPEAKSIFEWQRTGATPSQGQSQPL